MNRTAKKLILAGLLSALGLWAQGPAKPRPKFDIVSVRRCNPNGLPGPRSGEGGGRGTGPQYSPGRLRNAMHDGRRHDAGAAYLGLPGRWRWALNYMPSIGDENWLRKAPGWVTSELYSWSRGKRMTRQQKLLMDAGGVTGDKVSGAICFRGGAGRSFSSEASPGDPGCPDV